MTADQILILIILVSSIILFVSEKLRADVVALLVLLSLIVTGLLTVDEAFQGFASPAVVTVWAVFIISGGLQRSGVADIIAQYLLNWAGDSEKRLLIFIMLAAGIMSAFMNNIGAVAILMPAVISIGRRLNISPSKLLMPLAFSALLGGNITLIGTPPNILAASLMQNAGLEPFGFFDFAPTGLLVMGAGVIYMLLIGRKLIPDRSPSGGLSRSYNVRDYLSEVTLEAGSELAGKRLSETDLGLSHNLNVIRIRSPENQLLYPIENHTLTVGDTLLIEGTPQDIIQASKAFRLQPVTAFSPAESLAAMEADDFHLAEITLAPNSNLENQTVQQIDLRGQYNLSVLALRHNGVEQIDQL
ncbi:MAG: SLC13 family permease, partial [Anaerolineae bacterium]